MRPNIKFANIDDIIRIQEEVSGAINNNIEESKAGTVELGENFIIVA